MVKRTLLDYLKIGFKAQLVMFFGSSAILLPLLLLLGVQLGATITGTEIGNFGLLPLLAIPIIWSLNGFLLIKFKVWIFK